MHILIVEDEHKIAGSIKKGLEQEHFVADIAYTGTNGYDLASTESYDLIILDLMLPDMSGLEICTKLRLKAIHTPIIILTAKSQLEDKIAGLDAGADDYLTKPFSFEELLARIRALVRRPKEVITSVLIVGELSLDTKTYIVKRGNNEIRLSSKEFAILEYLMRHADQILTKDLISRNVWDYDADVLPNTIEVYLKNLRNKIDVPFPDKPNLLHTLRGFGYKISGK